MIEALQAVLITLGGAGLLVPWRRTIPPRAVVWLAFLTGAAVYLLSALAMLVVADRFVAWVGLAITLMVGSVGFAVSVRRGLISMYLGSIAWAAGIGLAVAVASWLLPLARLTIDSGEYLLGAVQIGSDGAPDLMGPYLLKRQMGLQALHALATSPIRAHVAWVGPLFGVSGVGLLVWLSWTRLEGRRVWRIAVVGGLLAFLSTSSRFFYDFFYVHPHIQMASFLLVAVAGVWLAVTESKPVWAMAAGLALAATLLLRPEAPVLVAVVLAAAVATPADRAARRLLAIPSLVTIVAWYGLVLWGSAPGGDAIGLTEPVLSSLVAVVGAAAAVLVLDVERFPVLHGAAGRVLVPAVAVVLLIYTVTDPILLRDSIVATFRNQKRLGWWVTTWAVTVPLAAFALLATRIRLAEFWGRIVVAFGLLFFTFPYVRGSPWRVGPGDSGNRMLAHFLLVVLAFVVLTFARSEPDHAD